MRFVRTPREALTGVLYQGLRPDGCAVLVVGGWSPNGVLVFDILFVLGVIALFVAFGFLGKAVEKL